MILAASGSAAVTTRSSETTGDPWRTLHRPFHFPRVASAAVCPRTSAQTQGTFAPLYGSGPVYGSGLGSANGIFLLEDQSKGWWTDKFSFVADPHVAGRVLVRGRRLDRLGSARFSGSGSDSPIHREAQLLFSPSQDGTQQKARSVRYLRVRGPGCYGLQIDGRAFSTTIIFEAIPKP